MAENTKQFFDLGQGIVGILEPDDEGLPMVTILAEADVNTNLPPQQIYIQGLGVEGISQLSRAIKFWRWKGAPMESVGPTIEAQDSKTELTIRPV